MIYQGSCHCGKIRYEVEGDIGEVTECNCSICRRRGHLLWFVPRSRLRLHTPESNLAPTPSTPTGSSTISVRPAVARPSARVPTSRVQ